LVQVSEGSRTHIEKAGRADEQAPKEYTTPLFQQSRF
jgi:hypothetical protein